MERTGFRFEQAYARRYAYGDSRNIDCRTNRRNSPIDSLNKSLYPVGALRNGRLAAKPSIITMARHIFELAVRHFVPTPHMRRRSNASRVSVPYGVLAQIILPDPPSENNDDS